MLLLSQNSVRPNDNTTRHDHILRHAGVRAEDAAVCYSNLIPHLHTGTDIHIITDESRPPPEGLTPIFTQLFSVHLAPILA